MSTNLSVRFDQSQLREIVGRVNKVIRKAVEEGVGLAVYHGVSNAKLGGFMDHTHQLRTRIYGRLEGWSAEWFWGFVHSPMAYTSYVELGTRPHMIWPKAAHGLAGPLRNGQTRRAEGPGPHEHIVGRGLALRWKGADAQQHFAKYVNHPGSAGFHFMKYAEEVARREIGKLIQGAIRPI